MIDFGKWNTGIISGEEKLSDLHIDVKQKIGYIRKKNTYYPYRNFDDICDKNIFIQYTKAEIILFSKIKNESHIISEWVDFYSKIGVTLFVIVDNGSTDSTLDILISKRSKDTKIEILVDTDNFYQKEGVWAEKLPQLYGKNKWCLNVDSDEFLFFNEHDNLKTLIRSLISNNQYFLQTYMLNIYPRTNIFKQKKIQDYSTIEQYLETLYYDYSKTKKKTYFSNYNKTKYLNLVERTNIFKRLQGLKRKKFGSPILFALGKVSFFFMPDNVNLAMQSGFHYFKINNEYTISYHNDVNKLYINPKTKTKQIELHYKNYIHGILLHLNFYNVRRFNEKFQNLKKNILYDKNISKQLDLKNLPYFYRKKLTSNNKRKKLNWDKYITHTLKDLN